MKKFKFSTGETSNENLEVKASYLVLALVVFLGFAFSISAYIGSVLATLIGLFLAVLIVVLAIVEAWRREREEQTTSKSIPHRT